jgi:hypothetical protein
MYGGSFPFVLIPTIQLSFMGDLYKIQIEPETSYEEFLTKVKTKLGERPLRLKYRDSEGDLVTLGDEGDYVLALRTAVTDGKLEIECTEASDSSRSSDVQG